MRRMFSENQIKEVVNKGIAEGKIKFKLYEHTINFQYTEIEKGALINEVIIPIYIVSKRKEPYTLKDIIDNGNILVDIPSGVMSISNDDNTYFTSFEYIEEGSTIITSTKLIGTEVKYIGITNFVDVVEEIAL